MRSYPKIGKSLKEMTPDEFKRLMFKFEEMGVIMKKMPPPGSEYKYEGKILSGKDISTGQPATINYLKFPQINKFRDPKFGEDVQPEGTYMTQSEGFVPIGWVSGVVTFNNPLVFFRLDDDLTHYKKKLSNQFGNKAGQDLTDELKRFGHDGIIVRNEYGYIGDIIAFDTATIKEYSEEDIAESQIEHRRALAHPPPLILD